MAKIADVFGRVNAYILSVVLYVLGYVIQASAPNIYVSHFRRSRLNQADVTLLQRPMQSEMRSTSSVSRLCFCFVSSAKSLQDHILIELFVFREHHHFRHFLATKPCLDDHLAKHNSRLPQRLGRR